MLIYILSAKLHTQSFSVKILILKLSQKFSPVKMFRYAVYMYVYILVGRRVMCEMVCRFILLCYLSAHTTRWLPQLQIDIVPVEFCKGLSP